MTTGARLAFCFVLLPLAALAQARRQVVATPPKPTVLKAGEAAPAATAITRQTPLPGDEQMEVTVRARIVRAQNEPPQPGELDLRITGARPGIGEPSMVTGSDREVSLRTPPGATGLVISLPLSSNGDAYGESRSCRIAKNGLVTFAFRAGLDEKNFVPFRSSSEDREFRFSVNKYLCRAMAAPFACKREDDGSVVQMTLPSDMSQWQIGGENEVVLQSADAPVEATATSVKVTSDKRPFDYRTCPQIAPSNGLCCVSHKTTEWHCGGAPSGDGWHQVSGDCFHRETGTSCKE